MTHPSDELLLVGITGTNGKTTTSYILTSIFEAAGVTCGRIGTVGYRINERETDAPRTTPEAPDLQRMLREMVTEGCGACVMEVSSHALSLRRVDGLRFAAGIFTNLTRDHLDFHGDMEAYFTAKRRLFELLPEGPSPSSTSTIAAAPTSSRRPRRPVTYAIDGSADVRPGPTAVLAGRTDVRHSHAAGNVARPLAPRRAAERLQHPRGIGCGDGAGSAVLRNRSRHRVARARARPLPDGLRSVR